MIAPAWGGPQRHYPNSIKNARKVNSYSIMGSITNKTLYHHHAGCGSLVVDGLILGHTTFLSEPYYVQPGDTTPRQDERVSENAEYQETHRIEPEGQDGVNFFGWCS